MVMLVSSKIDTPVPNKVSALNTLPWKLCKVVCLVCSKSNFVLNKVVSWCYVRIVLLFRDCDKVITISDSI